MLGSVVTTQIDSGSIPAIEVFYSLSNPALWSIKNILCLPGIELGTLRLVDRCDDHYTTKVNEIFRKIFEKSLISK